MKSSRDYKGVHVDAKQHVDVAKSAGFDVDIDVEEGGPGPWEVVVRSARETLERSYKRFYSAIDGGSTGWSDWVDDASRKELLDAMRNIVADPNADMWNWLRETPDAATIELVNENGFQIRALVVPVGSSMTRHYPPGCLIASSLLHGNCNIKSYITSKRQGQQVTRETASQDCDVKGGPWIYYGGPQRIVRSTSPDGVSILLEVLLSPPARLLTIYDQHTQGLVVEPPEKSIEALENLFTTPPKEGDAESLMAVTQSDNIGISLGEMRNRVGGLDNALLNITRRIFATRRFPPRVIERLGLQHVRGMLLYGPPGCGKTLLAREIARALNAREAKIVSGPEILNKWVGEAEKTIRGLFLEAEREQRDKGRDSLLHVIVLDEMDAVCKVRGTVSDGGVRDSVVNQLLAKMDGVDQLNNLLVIGLTNRRELIDPALLRPGRLEVQMYVGPPDEQGRQEILQVHLSNIFKGNHAGPGVVNLFTSGEIARQTDGFTGAELAGLVRSAMSFAIMRAQTAEELVVEERDIMRAIQEIKASLGPRERKRDRWKQSLKRLVGMVPNGAEKTQKQTAGPSTGQ